MDSSQTEFGVSCSGMNRKRSGAPKTPQLNSDQRFIDVQAMRKVAIDKLTNACPSSPELPAFPISGVCEVSQSMEQDHGENVETVLAQHMLRLFKHHDLTGSQAKSLLEKVRLRLDAGEIGLSNPER